MDFSCCFCGKSLRVSSKKNRKILQPICFDCRKALFQELGPDWEQSEWWQEYKQLHFAQQYKDNQYLANTKSLDSAKHVSVGLDGKLETSKTRPVEAIIRRLYASYGYNAKKIKDILTKTYKIHISYRMVAYLLNKYRYLPVERDAEFWRKWHEELDSLEKSQKTMYTIPNVSTKDSNDNVLTDRHNVYD